MGLFQKRSIIADSAPAYTISNQKTVLIIGLGNIGKEYKNTRHNVGFEVLDAFADSNDFPAWTNKKDLKADITSATIGSTRVVLCKPTTFMNASGEAAVAVQKYFRTYNQSTLVAYDELAIPFGQIRTRVGGEAAGHNGVKSLIQHLGDEFCRLRIGIANEISEKADAADFVLGKFSKEEQGDLPKIINESSAIITEFIYGEKLNQETRSLLR